MAKTKKHRSPARERYEKKTRVISCRVSVKLYDRLQRAKKVEGMSYTNILKAGLGLIEVKVRAEDEIRQKAYDEGEESGINRAAAIYMVSYPCGKCKKMIPVTTEEEKEAIRKFMVESGWCHADCNDRRY